ncbi:MAG: cobaltochelatase subunit CobN, partial [Methanimicrococcus sp.]|nr:cobaltochelatase subunit CobN [Methanimicrococcus sp.]
MISFKKFNTFAVLLILIFSTAPIIPAASADPVPVLIQGTDEKIDVLYIGYKGAQMIHVSSDMHDQMHYKDDFEIHTIIIDWMVGYQNEVDDYDLTTFDIVIVDMTIYELFGEFDAFQAAHNSGVTLVAVANSGGASTVVPEYFDFRDTAELTTSTAYPSETVETFFALYDAAEAYSDDELGIYKQIQLDYTENMLMFLAEARGKNAQVSAQYTDIIDKWEQNKIKITFIGFNAGYGRVNQYSSFMNVTFMNYWSAGGPQRIIDFGNSGGFKDQDLILIDMTTGGTIASIDAEITATENKIETVAKDGVTPVYLIRSAGPDYGIDIDDEYKLTRTMGEVNAQLLVFAAQKYERENVDPQFQITTDWVLKKAGLLYGIYHPDLAGKYYATLNAYLNAYTDYDPNNPTIGIWFHKSYLTDGRLPIIDDLIRDIESKDVNVIAGF